MKGEQIAGQALTWLGTPFQHQGRLKGVGVDCIGLVFGVARELAIWPAEFNFTAYGRSPVDGVLEREIAKRCDPVSEPEVGGLGLFRWFGEPQHIAIFLPDTRIVHSYHGARMVVSHGIDAKWRKRLVSCWRLRQIGGEHG